MTPNFATATFAPRANTPTLLPPVGPPGASFQSGTTGFAPPNYGPTFATYGPHGFPQQSGGRLAGTPQFVHQGAGQGFGQHLGTPGYGTYAAAGPAYQMGHDTYNHFYVPGPDGQGSHGQGGYGHSGYSQGGYGGHGGF